MRHIAYNTSPIIHDTARHTAGQSESYIGWVPSIGEPAVQRGIGVGSWLKGTGHRARGSGKGLAGLAGRASLAVSYDEALT